MLSRTFGRPLHLWSALLAALVLPLGCSGSSEHVSPPKPPEHVAPPKPVAVTSASAAASIAAVPPTPPPPQQCELAPALRAKVKPLLAEGRLNRALRVIEKADRLCTASEPETWAAHVMTLADLGRCADARAVAAKINASTQASNESKGAAMQAIMICDIAVQPDSRMNRESRDAAQRLVAEAVALQKKSDKAAQTRAMEKYVEAWQAWHPNPQALVQAAMTAKKAGQDAEAQRLFDKAVVDAEKMYGKEAVLEMPDGRMGSSFDWSGNGQRIASIRGNDVSIFDANWVELLRLPGEGGVVTLIAYAPDDQTLATVSKDNIVRLWDTTSATVIQQLAGHTAEVHAVRFFRDGKTLASWSKDMTARLWDVASGKEIRKFPTDGGGIDLSPDGKTLVIDSSTSLRFLDIASGTEIRKLPAVERFDYSPDGKTFATLSNNAHEVVLHDAASGKELHKLPHEAKPNVFMYSSDGKMLAVGARAYVNLWDVSSGKLIRSTYVSPGIIPKNGGVVGSPAVYGLGISPNGKKVVFVSASDNTGGIVDVASGRETHKLIASDGIEWASFLPDGKTILTESEKGTLTFWDVASGKQLRTIGKSAQSLESIAYSPDGKSLATGSQDETVRLWDLTGDKGVRKIGKHAGTVSSVAYSPDGKSLASGDDEGSLHQWDIASGKEIRKFKELTRGISSVAYSPDGKLLATASYDSITRIWDVATGKERHKLKSESYVNAVAFSPDGKTLASAGDDHIVQLWDVASGKEYGKLDGHKRDIASLSFSPDGKTLVTGAADDTVRLWDLASGKEIKKLAATWHIRHAKSLPFSPDGKLLALAANDYNVQLWDLASGTDLRKLVGHTNAIHSVAFSPNGKFVASGDGNGLTMLHRVEDGALLGSLKAISTLDAGHVTTSAGYIDLLGRDACAARKLAVCHVGAMVWPLEVCEERFLVPGLLAKLQAGDTSYIEPEASFPRMVCPKTLTDGGQSAK
jgi:WD40 repeat protein